jgi:tight adherence protein B
MMLTAGAAIFLAAVVLLGFAVIVRPAPEVPLDRRRPYEADPLSQVTRIAASTVRAFDKALEGGSLRLFNREKLEHAGLRMTQAEFIVLVLAGGVVGALVGMIVLGPVLAILLFILAPFVGHLVLNFRAG